MTATELMFWEPGDTRAQVRPVTSAAQVRALADDLLARYRAAGDLLPGIELRGADGESLSIAVGPSGWALVHTDAEFTQHCTRRDDDADGESPRVRWEEPTPIPGSWFVPAESALAGVDQWLTDGTLAPQLPWSDQCF